MEQQLTVETRTRQELHHLYESFLHFHPALSIYHQIPGRVFTHNPMVGTGERLKGKKETFPTVCAHHKGPGRLEEKSETDAGPDPREVTPDG